MVNAKYTFGRKHKGKGGVEDVSTRKSYGRKGSLGGEKQGIGNQKKEIRFFLKKYTGYEHDGGCVLLSRTNHRNRQDIHYNPEVKEMAFLQNRAAKKKY